MDKRTTVAAICQTLHISRATLYRYLKTEHAQKTDQSQL
jgi:predicted transcriptional regulator YheO